MLAQLPRQEEVDALLVNLQTQATSRGIFGDRDDLLLDQPNWRIMSIGHSIESAIGVVTPTFAEQVFAEVEGAHDRIWQERVGTLNWELHDVGIGVLESTLVQSLLDRKAKCGQAKRRAGSGNVGRCTAATDTTAKTVLLWRKTRLELVNEMNSDLQMPGWGNIWTQPIINRVNMLATGVRTQIGVKIFGPVGKTLEAKRRARSRSGR